MTHAMRRPMPRSAAPAAGPALGRPARPARPVVPCAAGGGPDPQAHEPAPRRALCERTGSDIVPSASPAALAAVMRAEAGEQARIVRLAGGAAR